MSTTIRPASRLDAPWIADLLTVLGHTTAPAAVTSRWPAWEAAGNTALVAVAADNVTVTGLVTLHLMHVLHRPKPVGRITALVVSPAFRNQGVGRALVREAETRLLDAGCGLLEVTSNLRLKDAHAFYQHLGYSKTSTRFAKPLLAA